MLPEREPINDKLLFAGESRASAKHQESNEDYILQNEQLCLFGVFDAVGSHNTKGAPARLAAKLVEEKVAVVELGLAEQQWAEELKKILFDVSRDLFDRGLGGTTASIIKIIETPDKIQKVVIGNVGDSRVYKIEKNCSSLTMVTLDDSPFPAEGVSKLDLQKLLANVEDYEELEDDDLLFDAFNQRNRLTQYLGYRGYNDGAKGYIQPHIYILELDDGEGVLLTTDGIHDNLTHKEIEQIILSAASDPKLCSRMLISAAYERANNIDHCRQKEDDMTAVVIYLKSP